MRRRDFIKATVSVVTAWPVAAHAQQGERVRHVGVLMALAATDAEGQARLAAFLQGLQEYGWAVGRNVIIDTRWSTGNNTDFRKYAMELVALGPDVILAYSSAAVAPFVQMTVPFQLCLRMSPIQLALVMSTA